MVERAEQVVAKHRSLAGQAGRVQGCWYMGHDMFHSADPACIHSFTKTIKIS